MIHRPHTLKCHTVICSKIWQHWVKVKVKVKVPLRLAVYRQLIRLGTEPLETHDQIFFLQLNPSCHSLYDEIMNLSLVNMLGLLSSVRIALIACYCKFFLVHCIQVLCQYMLYKADHVYLRYFILQRQLSNLNGRKLGHPGLSRAEQSSSLLPATSQHGHSWHRAPLGPMVIYLFCVKTFVFFFFFRCSSFDKTEGLSFFL
jgi:hypothetical protein